MAHKDWPIIVAGCHRSGTSLLRRLLNGHPEIFCPPEITFFLDLLGQFPHDPYSHVRLGTTVESFGLPKELWIKHFGKALVACYTDATRAHGKSLWADKNPSNAINVQEWEIVLGQEFIFVMVVRHPLDVLASLLEAKMDKMIPVDLIGKCRHIRNFVESGINYANKHKNRSFILAYEDLVLNPQSTLTELCDFIGIKYEPSMLSQITSSNQGDGLEDPKVKKMQKPIIFRDSVNRWTKDLSREELKVAYEQLNQTSKTLGYAVQTLT